MNHHRLLQAIQNTKFGRTLAPLIWTVRLIRTPRRCIVRRHGNAWKHRFLRGVVYAPSPGVRNPAEIRRRTEEIYLWGMHLRKGATVLDVGAGIGGELDFFSDAVGPQGRIIALEASPLTYSCLLDNIEENEWLSVEPLHVAASDVTGIAHIGDSREGHIMNRVSKTRTGVPVAAMTLDDICAAYEIKEIDLLKMNIEGAEVAALAGATSTLKITQRIYVSAHDFMADRLNDQSLRTRAQVIEILERAGFQLRFRPKHQLRPVRDAVYGVRS